MLYLYFGNIDREKIFGDKYVAATKEYFDWGFNEEWMKDPLVEEMIKDVDKSELVAPNYIMSPVLGPIPPTTLSTGVKTLILLNSEEDIVPSGERLGDNCWRWVFEIGKKKDITIPLNHPFRCLSLEYDWECIVVNMKNYHFRGKGRDFFFLHDSFDAFQAHKVWCKDHEEIYKPLQFGHPWDAYLE